MLPAEFKRCNLRHGPVANNCNNLQAVIESSIVGVNTINFTDVDLTYMSNATRICVALRAWSGNKPWEMVGIYDTGTGVLSYLTNNDTTTMSPLYPSHKPSSAETSLLQKSILILIVCVIVIGTY